MPTAKKYPKLTASELETLLKDGLARFFESDVAHEHIYHSSPKFKRAQELLSREGYLDKKGELTPEAMKILAQIVKKDRPVGPPLENAILEVSHIRQEPDRSPSEGLVAKGLTTELEITDLGWEVILNNIDGLFLKAMIEAWTHELLTVDRGRDSVVEKWRGLEPYVSSLHPEPEHSLIAVHGPPQVVQECNELLMLARLCIIVGAWTGAVQYCSVAVESLILSVLVSKGLRKPFEDLPALQELAGELGKRVPEVSPLTKRLVSVIANFRNDSVHPRDPHLRPGESQARTVYDMTLRFMGEVRAEWFIGT